MDQKTIDELAALGIYVVPLDEAPALHRLLIKILEEEYLLDRRTHEQNKEWTNE